MTFGTRSFSITLLISAAILVVLTILVATIIIPLVKADPSPQALPAQAAAAFWIHSVINLIVGLFLAAAAIWAKRNRASIISIGVLAAITFLLALAYLDAGGSFRGHDPEMQGAAKLLLIFAAAEFAAVILAIISMFRAPKRVAIEPASQVTDA